MHAEQIDPQNSLRTPRPPSSHRHRLTGLNHGQLAYIIAWLHWAQVVARRLAKRGEWRWNVYIRSTDVIKAHGLPGAVASHPPMIGVTAAWRRPACWPLLAYVGITRHHCSRRASSFHPSTQSSVSCSLVIDLWSFRDAAASPTDARGLITRSVKRTRSLRFCIHTTAVYGRPTCIWTNGLTR